MDGAGGVLRLRMRAGTPAWAERPWDEVSRVLRVESEEKAGREGTFRGKQSRRLPRIGGGFNAIMG